MKPSAAQSREQREDFITSLRSHPNFPQQQKPIASRSAFHLVGICKSHLDRASLLVCLAGIA
jgi:hypothetical protein